MRQRSRLLRSLSLAAATAVLAVSFSAVPATGDVSASQGGVRVLAEEPAPLPEWSGSVLGGTPLELPARKRTIAFASIHPGANFTLGIDTTGLAWSWGVNGWGQLGNSEYMGRYTFAPYPVPLLGGDGTQLRARDLSAGENFSVVLDESGAAWTHGRNNFGQLGNPEIPTGNVSAGMFTPVAVVNAEGEQMKFDQISAGVSFAFGLSADGHAWAWGRNYYGQLGAPSNSRVFVTPISSVATPVLGQDDQPMRFAQIVPGEDFAIAIDLDGQAWGWGNNYTGQIGSPGDTVDRPRPILDAGGRPHRFTQVAAGYNTSYGIDEHGKAWAWGSNSDGQLGNPNYTSTSIPVPVLTAEGTQMSLRSVSTKGVFTVGVDEHDQVWAWGSNRYGQLGQDADADAVQSSPTPIQMFRSPGNPLLADNAYAGNSHVTAIGDFDESALTNSWAWGASWFGQLGNPDIDTSDEAYHTSPQPISLPQPTTNSIVYFGDDDEVGVTGTVSDGVLHIKSPRHLSGRVPVYAAWFGDEPTRELIGYFTFTLAPTLTVTPATLGIEETATAIVQVPDEEIPLIGEARIRFDIEDPALTVVGDPERPFLVTPDAQGKAQLPVTSRDRGTYNVKATAIVEYPDEPRVVNVSAEMSAWVTFEANVIVTPPVRSKFGSLTLHKVDGEGRPLTGAKFNLFVSHSPTPDFSVRDNTDIGVRDVGVVCDMTVDEATSCIIRARYSDWAESEQLEVGDHRWNYYWIVESQAPEGYELLATRIPFQITKDLVDEEHAIPDRTITNVKARGGVVLPFTGGSGTGVFVVIGVIALLAGIALIAGRAWRQNSAPQRVRRSRNDD